MKAIASQSIHRFNETLSFHHVYTAPRDKPVRLEMSRGAARDRMQLLHEAKPTSKYRAIIIVPGTPVVCLTMCLFRSVAEKYRAKLSRTRR